ncbi:diguanylate cyclase [Marinitoga sp. 1135]|uniref:Diguanylate cyclase (GGDEF) domain-containing protein n=1 Tax=Marinitoga piezophila (strain DSM 14283 / JCM 11233 / KA3) TaxID=443254 RepID=H2J729_MARPK|nr:MULTISPECIES: diguanylate cyclase [Marinitoga]AEX86399.1 diguanylate cyclase (GGDEF) domain-containing protein [Marinitoga piezophila KA3]APT76790.1 diguanylate cyclase [Marinitoga sp. 1137]NUU96560.1 diguanylate cyclase [Marinitoga sp. 1135]NUU98491.1 diguanylate cyclase [Marinitoga sp. 1138]
MKKVLVLDDSISWRIFLKKSLEQYGYDVEVAENGLEGINKFFDFLPDIIISDYVMPQMNGVHLCRFIRSYAAFSNVGIIILTGANESINEFWAKKSGANMFLRKDADPEELMNKIKEFIEDGNYSIEWTREFHKFRMEPFRELVDILEESLKMEVIKSSILNLVEKMDDEEHIMREIYLILEEFFNFENAFFMLISTSFGRMYSFSKDKNYSCSVLKDFLFSNFKKPTTPSEWIIKGMYDDAVSKVPDNYSVFNIEYNKIEQGLILFENVKNEHNMVYVMNMISETLGILFKTLNNFYDYKTAAENDGLTGLLNKKNILDKLKEFLITFRRKNYPLSIAMIDIDDFKKINDTYGHVTGDKVLKNIATIINSEMRENDFAGRFGGEEFLILMPGTSCIEAKKALERILESVRNYNWKDLGINLPVTFSAGVACNYQNKSATIFINTADKLLYRAKKKGKNRIIIEEE